MFCFTFGRVLSKSETLNLPCWFHNFIESIPLTTIYSIDKQNRGFLGLSRLYKRDYILLKLCLPRTLLSYNLQSSMHNTISGLLCQANAFAGQWRASVAIWDTDAQTPYNILHDAQRIAIVIYVTGTNDFHLFSCDFDSLTDCARFFSVVIKLK